MEEADDEINGGVEFTTHVPIANSVMLDMLIENLKGRSEALPGIGVFSGPSGLGKTTAAEMAIENHDAVHIVVDSIWSRRDLFQKIAQEMNLPDSGTTTAIAGRIAEELAERRPLIIDEADFLLKKGMVDDLRGLYERSQGVLILIGEENLPAALEKWERMASRVLSWVQAVPLSDGDARMLAKLFCPDIEIADDLFRELLKISSGSARRVSTNLHIVKQAALTNGVRRVGFAEMGDSKFTSGRAPKIRRFS